LKKQRPSGVSPKIRARDAYLNTGCTYTGAIKDVVAHLSDKKFEELVEAREQAWDRQIEADAEARKLGQLAKEALRDYRERKLSTIRCRSGKRQIQGDQTACRWQPALFGSRHARLSRSWRAGERHCDLVWIGHTTTTSGSSKSCDRDLRQDSQPRDELKLVP
jgi:hypothetical protein